jgi:hypothetical protein
MPVSTGTGGSCPTVHRRTVRLLSGKYRASTKYKAEQQQSNLSPSLIMYFNRLLYFSL